MSFYGFNIHAVGVKNTEYLINHVRRARPKWLLVMDGLELCKQLLAASPETNVIHRNYGVTQGDDGVFAKVSPEQWLDLRAKEAEEGVWLMTTCEPGWGADVIAWHVRLMKLCIPRKIRLVVGNWSVGTPDPSVIEMAKPLLELCAAHPELFVVGLHEYANAVITSGFTGGAPDGWDQGHNKQHHPDYQKPESWPLNGEAKIKTKWHIGRFQFWLEYCRSVGIPLPRIVLTETGFDDVSDVKFWTNTLPRTDGYDGIRGFKTLQTYWKQVFPQWSHDRAYFEQLKYAQGNIFEGTPVEGACIYCYGHIDPNWAQFDTEGHTELLGYLEDYTVQPTPNYKPAEFVAGDTYTLVIKGAYRNLRETPGVGTGKLVGQVNAGEVVTALEQKIVASDYWWKIQTKAGDVGWVSFDGGAVEMRKIVPPPVVVPPPVIVLPTPAPETKPTAWARLYDAQMKVTQANLDLLQVLRDLRDEETRIPKAA